MTLIEVVVGLAFLGSILVGLLLAQERLSRQWIGANSRMRAVRAADQLLSCWQSEGKSMPLNASGPVETDGHFQWSTHIVRTQSIETIPVSIVRLDIYESAGAELPLTSVEVLTGSRKALP